MLATAFLTLSACSTTSAPETYTQIAPGVDFRGVRTYGFLAEASTEVLSPLNERIGVAFDSEVGIAARPIRKHRRCGDADNGSSN